MAYVSTKSADIGGWWAGADIAETSGDSLRPGGGRTRGCAALTKTRSRRATRRGTDRRRI
jgi:hypothetical protein